jgi:hypothetical protein
VEVTLGAPRVGAIVLVAIGASATSPVLRPLVVTSVTPDGRVSGVIQCEQDDYQLPAFRGHLDRMPHEGRIEGRPSHVCPVGWAKELRAGTAIGQWQWRPRTLEAR